MKQETYDFREFQRELAALDDKKKTDGPTNAESKGQSVEARLQQAEAEFTALRKRYRLTVAHVVAFFPEEEGIAYLQKLIAEQKGPPQRRKRVPKQSA